MTYDDKINIFKKHLTKLNQWDTDFDVWLATAIEHVHEIFTILSQQHTSITQIKNDYTFAQIRDKSEKLKSIYKLKLTQLIEGFIEQLQEKKRISIAEATQKQQIEVKREINFQQRLEELIPKYNALFTENKRLENELNSIRNQPKPKRIYWKAINGVYHFNITLFWTLAPLAILLTIFFSSLKFDNDKINLSEKNQELKTDTANLSTQLRTAQSQIEAMKSKQVVQDTNNNSVPSNSDTAESILKKRQ